MLILNIIVWKIAILIGIQEDIVKKIALITINATAITYMYLLLEFATQIMYKKSFAKLLYDLSNIK